MSCPANALLPSNDPDCEGDFWGPHMLKRTPINQRVFRFVAKKAKGLEKNLQ